jgi:para-aminobenzoate synthetase / 4-amino-4-deoxychorismate lyase
MCDYGGYFLPLERLVEGAFATRVESPAYGDGWVLFERPADTLTAHLYEDVETILEQAARAVDSGMSAAGYVSFEASPAFDAALEVSRSEGSPLAQFCLYQAPPVFFKELAPPPPATLDRPRWVPDVDESHYAERFRAIREHLARGESYQVNYTFRLRRLLQEPLAHFFARQAAAHPPPLATFFQTDRVGIASLSPELFFERDGPLVWSRPIKGTAPRGATWAEDEDAAARLQGTPKETAENLMVVDMIRNDLGRIAEVGSVRVPKLFEVERHATVLQMSSTVEAKVHAGLPEIFRALFPCASVVGAPKVATMRIIRGLEASPRGLYTGAIGFAVPGAKARFSVAIRTAVLEAGSGELVYGVGSGIVWDSEQEREWRECLLKAAVVARRAPEWALLETMGFSGRFLHLEEHLARLERSARELDVPFERNRILGELEAAAKGFGPGLQRVRLLLDHGGSPRVEAREYQGPPECLSARLALSPVASGDPGLRFKTTFRALYERHLREAGGADEALLWNEREELTEFCSGNLVLNIGGEFLTPPTSCGLLDGVLRAKLVRERVLEERVLRRADLGRADEVFRISSLAGWVKVKMIVRPD